MTDHTFDPADWHERPQVFDVGPAHESVFDSPDGDQLDGQTAVEKERWLAAVSNITTAFDLGPNHRSPVDDRTVDRLIAYVHVGAELARLLLLFVDASDPMEATDDALVALDAWSELEAAALREVVGS